MTILDANAVLAYLMDEAPADDVEVLLEQGDAALATVGIVEVIDRLVRRVGATDRQAVVDLAALQLAAPLALDNAIATAAGRLRARHYHRAAISLADCVAAETARTTGRPLATGDVALLGVCHAEGIPTLALRRRETGPPHGG